MIETSGFGHWDFGHLVLFRISDFDIRILKKEKTISEPILKIPAHAMFSGRAC
jgi:hypothetical protein